MPHVSAASASLISPFSHRRTTSPKFSGIPITGRPNFTPFALAAAIPWACRLRIASRSFWATKDRICRTIELDEKFCDVIVKRYIEQVGSSSGVTVQRDGLTYTYDELAAEPDEEIPLF